MSEVWCFEVMIELTGSRQQARSLQDRVEEIFGSIGVEYADAVDLLSVSITKVLPKSESIRLNVRRGEPVLPDEGMEVEEQ